MTTPRLAGAVALAVLATVAPYSDAPAQQAATSSPSMVFARSPSADERPRTIQILNLRTDRVRELFDANNDVYELAVSPGGTEVAYVTAAQTGDQIRIVGADGSGDRGLVDEGLIVDSVSWTPDGSQLVYSSGPYDGRGNRQLKRSEIYSIATDGGEPTRLTRDDSEDFDPSVTPDGERIVFSRDEDLHSMAIDGTDITRLTNTKADEIRPQVSPDGRRIVFVRDRDIEKEDRLRRDVQVVDINGDNRVTVMGGKGNEEAPAWSPNSKRIAFSSDRARREQLYSARADGTGVRRLLKSAFNDTLPTYVP